MSPLVVSVILLCLLPSPTIAHNDVRHLGHAVTKFAFDLYDKLQEQTADNIIFSPLGLSGLMSMFVDGTEGETQQQIIDTLSLQYDFQHPKEISPAYQQLYGVLENATDEGMVFTMASRISPMKGLKLVPDYIRSMIQHYGASVEELDFRNDPEGALENINQWFSNKTNGMIEEAVSELDPNTILALMNGMYFQGTWEVPFPAKNTHTAKFYGDEGTVDVAMMSLERVQMLGSWDEDNFRLLELPYSDNHTSMLLVLPKSGVDLYTAMTSLRYTDVASVISRMRYHDVYDVQLPRFKVEANYDLEDTLQQIGMERLFGVQAEMAPMFGFDGLHLSTVSHATELVVTETGTEAGSASFAVSGTSADKPTFIVDRPFAFLVYDRRSECTMFLGAVKSLSEDRVASPADKQTDMRGNGAIGKVAESIMVWCMAAVMAFILGM